MVLNWSGNWENRGDRFICRWMVAWTMNNTEMMGAISGYSGGGAFQLEKFFITVDGRYYIEANEDLEFLSAKQIDDCESCVDIILNFHNAEDWFENENLHLLNERLTDLQVVNNGCFGGEIIPVALLKLFSLIGLISYPALPQQ
jgi:hypothetical protein